MKKITKFLSVRGWKHLLLVAGLALAGSLSASAQTVIQEGVPFAVYYSSFIAGGAQNFSGTFTPEQSGTIAISYDPAITNPTDNFLFNGTTPMQANAQGEYSVTKGTTYQYLVGSSNPSGTKLKVPATSALYYSGGDINVTFTLTPSGDDGDDNPGGGEGNDGAPVITPANNSNIANDLYGVTIQWGETVAKGANWADGVTVTVSENGTKEWDPSVSLIDEEGYQIWDDDDETVPTGITIAPGCSAKWTDDGPKTFTVEITVPAGLVTIDGKANEELKLNYTVIPVNVELVANPSRGSKLAQLSELTISFECVEGQSVERNPDYEGTILYGECGMFGDPIGESEPVESVTPQADGTFLVKIGKTISEAGTYAIYVPKSYFLLNTPDGKVPVEGETIQYSIAPYLIYPAGFAYVNDVLSSITVASVAGDIEVVGDITRITLVDQETDEVIGTGKTAKATTYEDENSGEEFDAVEVEFSSPFDFSGVAVVTIPANIFSFDGKTFDQAIRLEYYVTPPVPEPTIVPANGSTVKQLDVIEIDWRNSPLSEGFYDPEYDDPIYIVYGDKQDEINEYITIDSEMAEGPHGDYVASSKLVIDFGDTPYTAAGEYKIVLPYGYVYVENYGNEPNTEIELSYTVDPSFAGYMEEGTIEIYGELDNKYVQSVGNLYVTWEYQPVSLVSGKSATLTVNGKDYTIGGNGIHVIDGRETGGGTPANKPSRAAAENQNTFVLDLPNEVFMSQPKGTYVLSIPEGIAVNNDGAINPAQEFTFYVVAETTVDATITPEVDAEGKATVKTLPQVSVSWNSLPIEVIGTEIRVRDTSGEFVNVTPVVVSNALVLNLEDITTVNGEYEVLIPTGSVIITEGETMTLNQEINVTYVVTEAAGINSFVDAENGIFTVYNLNGIMVLRGDADALSTLAPGLYIINGKKVLVRK